MSRYAARREARIHTEQRRRGDARSFQRVKSLSTFWPSSLDRSTRRTRALPRRGAGVGRYVRSETVDTCSWTARTVGGGRRQADAESARESGRFRGATYRPAPAPRLGHLLSI